MLAAAWACAALGLTGGGGAWNRNGRLAQTTRRQAVAGFGLGLLAPGVLPAHAELSIDPIGAC